MQILTSQNLCKYYGSGENMVKALDNVSVSIDDGEFVSIIGTSGSGKSTLLNMLGGLDRPTSGEVYVKNKKLSDMNDEELTIFRRRNIGFIFQNYNLVPVLNVYENIVLPIELDGTKVDKNYIQTIIKTLGLNEKVNAMPNQLSGGQQQRVAIARALAMKPEVLCFDEPTSALDPELTVEVLKVIKDLKNQGRTMIVVTHEMKFARNVADKIIYMADGVIEEMGTPQQLFENPQSEKTRSFLLNEKD